MLTGNRSAQWHLMLLVERIEQDALGVGLKEFGIERLGCRLECLQVGLHNRYAFRFQLRKQRLLLFNDVLPLSDRRFRTGLKQRGLHILRKS